MLISCSKHFWFEQCFNGKYQFLIFVIFYHKNTEVPNRKFLTFFPFGRILKHDLYFHFNPVNNEEKNWNWAANFASPTMLQSVAWLSFSIFGKSLTIEIAINFQFLFSAKALQIVDRTTQEGGGRVHSRGNFFFSNALYPDPLPSMWIFFFFAPAPLPPLPRYTSLERRKREIRIYRVVTFPNMNDFSAECIEGLVITQRKTHSEVSL